MVNELVSILFESRLQSHVFHLVTDNYARHKAYQEYYENIVPLVDSLAEATAASNSQLMEYFKEYRIENQEELSVLYFQSLQSRVKEKMEIEMFDYPACRTIIEEILKLINSTLYKLEFLS